MTKLTDLDPRLAGWAEAEALGTSCECCGALAADVLVDRYSSGWLCDDCACGPALNVEVSMSRAIARDSYRRP